MQADSGSFFSSGHRYEQLTKNRPSFRRDGGGGGKKLRRHKKDAHKKKCTTCDWGEVEQVTKASFLSVKI